MLRLVLLRLLESYFRHRWLNLLPIVLMLGLAIASIFLQQKPLYLSEGILYVQRGSLLNSLTSVRNDSFTWLTPAQETAEEINDLMKTDAFMRAVVSKTDLEDEMSGSPVQMAELISGARESVWVRPNGRNQLLIGAAHEKRTLPAQLVNAIVDNYVQWQINKDLTESVVAQSFFQDLTLDYLADLEQARQQFDEYLIAHPEPERGDRPHIERIQIARLEGNVRLAEQRYAKTIESDEVARLAMTQAESLVQQSYFLIDAPKDPFGPEVSLKSLVVNMAIFIIVGVIISGAGIVGGALLDRSLRVPLDVQHGLNLPVLASISDVTELLLLSQEESKQVTDISPAADITQTATKQMQGQNTLVEPRPSR